MYHFLQFRADKKEAWRFHDQRQLSQLEKKPAFITVLAVDQDPEVFAENGEDPIDHVKYFGPMYWDFDGPDINAVLDDVRKVLDWLHARLDINKQFIHCWLSGQKGVHITVPAEVWGVRTPVKALPLTYREIAAHCPVETLDTGVYSCGRGRMWRCEGVPRPGSGRFKVGVTYDELMDMDEGQYDVLVAAARPPLAIETPAKSLIFPKAEALAKTAKAMANKKLRALKNAKTFPIEELKQIEGVPGCIQKLITEGDCVESNWNQAAMQVAAYVAARYEHSEDSVYLAEIVQPFVKNVDSSSRPTEKERLKHVKEQLNRAFSGRIKFSMGPLISVLGKPCGSCPLCRADLAADSPHKADQGYCELTKVKVTPAGYFLVGENSMRNLTTFTFTPHTEVRELESDGQGLRETQRKAMLGTLVDDMGTKFEDFMFPESAWGSRKELISLTKGHGTSTVHCSDAEVQKLLRAVIGLAGSELEKMTRTPVCGIILEETKRGIVPHYIEASGSYTQHNLPSRFQYSGDRNKSPDLLSESYPFIDDEELEQTFVHLLRVNTPEVVAPVLGWTVACHFREQIQMETSQFPLLNLSGSSSAGKSSLAFLVLLLSGMDYGKGDFVNTEVSTIYPLIKEVTSSTTVPRLIEEVNPSMMPFQIYNKVLGILKASWNRAGIPRGTISGKEVRVTTDQVSSPIVFTSEQAPTMPAVKTRSVEVKLTGKALRDPNYVSNYKKAMKTRKSLLRMAKALVTKSLNTSNDAVMQRLESFDSMVPDSIGPRPKFGIQVVLFGLEMLAETMDEFKVHGSSDVRELINLYKDHLQMNYSRMEKEKSVSEVDRVLACFDLMAAEREEGGMSLVPGTHYWRKGDQLYLDLTMAMPRYCRFAKSMGDTPVIRDSRQMASLLDGEIYMERVEQHPHKPGVSIYVISIAKIAGKGTNLTNFQNNTEAEE